MENSECTFVLMKPSLCLFGYQLNMRTNQRQVSLYQGAECEPLTAQRAAAICVDVVAA